MKRLSPLRYPGGKGQMYDAVASLITLNDLTAKTYVEPFAGGFAIGINLLKNNIVPRAIINDIDFHVYAFWKSVFGDPDGLIRKIENAQISIKEWHNQREIYNKCDKSTPLELGFATLFLNRTNFSGILKARPIGGLKQNGKYKLDCRFPKERLARIISEISEFRDHIEIYNLDAKCFIEDVLSKRQNDIFVNFDPPYVKKGKSLYTNFYKEEDHRELGRCIAKNLTCDWIMTYDNDPLIHDIYSKNLHFTFNLGYSANKHTVGTELFVSKKNYSHNIRFSA